MTAALGVSLRSPKRYQSRFPPRKGIALFTRFLAVTFIAAAIAPIDARADALQGKLLASIKATRPDGYSFQRTLVIERSGAPRKVFVERYDPRRPTADRWSLVSVDGQAPSAKEVAQSRKAKRGPTPSYAELAEWFGAPAARSDTTPGYATYHFARLPAGVLKIGSHDASPDTQAEALVNLKGATPYVERIRFVSTKGFRMMMVASIQSLDITGRYRLLPNGAPIPDGSASVMAGSLLGKSGQMKTSVTFDAVKPVD